MSKETATPFLKTKFQFDPAALAQAKVILNKGGLVAFPTETVYGLGADAENPFALTKIFSVKGRPVDHPLIIHMADASMMKRYARDIPDSARLLAERFWPGPLTLILRRSEHVSDWVTGGQDTVGLRVPAHPVAQSLLSLFERGIAAPSANRFGRISPTTAEHVRSELGASVDLILDGGPCMVGLESTILDLTGATPQVLRPGSISQAMLAEVLGISPMLGGRSKTRVLGQLTSHYSPRTPLRLVDKQLLQQILEANSADQSIAVLAMHNSSNYAQSVYWVNMPHSAELYGREIYARLHEVDRANFSLILVETPPTKKDWDAVHDRLSRSAASDLTNENQPN